MTVSDLSRYDDGSDLDLDVLVTPGTHDATYERLLARVHDDHVWEVPREVWPDGRQCFVNPRQPGPDPRARRRGGRPLPALRPGPVVRLLRVEHCPWRHDYGLRYLDEDLPADVAARVTGLVPGVAGADLHEQSAACFARLDELLGQGAT